MHLAQDVTRTVDDDEVVGWLRELLRLPSITGNEEAASLFVAGVLSELGLAVDVQDYAVGRPNVIAVLRGEEPGPTVLLNGHIDTVPIGADWTMDPFGGLEIEGRFYGRGAADMKGGIASMMGAASALRRSGGPMRGSVIVTAVVDEEADQGGIKRLVDSGVQADFGIVCEPTTLVPNVAHKGDLHYEVEVAGKAAHSSRPQLGINAIDGMAFVLIALQELRTRLATKKHPHLGSPTLSVGLIEGGTDTCVVPDRCTISVDRRLLPNESVEEADAEIQEALDRAAASNDSLRVHMRRTVTAPPMEISPDAVVVRAARKAATAVLGVDPGIGYKVATTDATYLSQAGIPTVLLGPGDPACAHTADEYITRDQVLQGARIIALAAVELLGTEKVDVNP